MDIKLLKELESLLEELNIILPQATYGIYTGPSLEGMVEYTYSEEMNISLTSFFDSGYTVTLAKGPSEAGYRLVETIMRCLITYLKYKIAGEVSEVYHA